MAHGRDVGVQDVGSMATWRTEGGHSLEIWFFELGGLKWLAGWIHGEIGSAKRMFPGSMD